MNNQYETSCIEGVRSELIDRAALDIGEVDFFSGNAGMMDLSALWP